MLNTFKKINEISEDDLKAELEAFGSASERKTNMILEIMYGFTEKADALSYIYDIIEDSFAKRCTIVVDEILFLLNPKKCDIIISTGILRCCSRAKTHLNNFNFAIENVKNHINSQGLDSNYLLRGLV